MSDADKDFFLDLELVRAQIRPQLDRWCSAAALLTALRGAAG